MPRFTKTSFSLRQIQNSSGQLFHLTVIPTLITPANPA